MKNRDKPLSPGIVMCYNPKRGERTYKAMEVLMNTSENITHPSQ
jgi:hypothetical protein